MFGDSTLYPNVPVHITAGTIDLGAQGFANTITGSSLPPSITLDSGVVLRGRGVSATVAIPITNLGSIIADQVFTTDLPAMFSASPQRRSPIREPWRRSINRF